MKKEEESPGQENIFHHIQKMDAPIVRNTSKT